MFRAPVRLPSGPVHLSSRPNVVWSRYEPETSARRQSASSIPNDRCFMRTTNKYIRKLVGGELERFPRTLNFRLQKRRFYRPAVDMCTNTNTDSVNESKHTSQSKENSATQTSYKYKPRALSPGDSHIPAYLQAQPHVRSFQTSAHFEQQPQKNTKCTDTRRTKKRVTLPQICTTT